MRPIWSVYLLAKKARAKFTRVASRPFPLSEDPNVARSGLRNGRTTFGLWSLAQAGMREIPALTTYALQVSPQNRS